MNGRMQRWKTGFWWAAAAAQILFLCGVSLRAGGAVIDNDAAKAYTHMMAIWESGSVLVPDWSYITTMELDCTTLLALPFYGLTGNPVLSFWCGNVILLGLWAALIVALVRRLGGSAAKGALAVLAVLLPYELYTTAYWNMMFLNAAQYAFKVMLPLLLILLLAAPERPRRRDWALLVLFLAGCWLTGFSSGIYVAACGLAPVLALWCLGWLKNKNKADPYRLACLGGSAAATLLGVGLRKALNVQTSVSSMRLNSLETLRDNAANCVIGFFRLFGAAPKAAVPVFSAEGVSCLLRMGLAGGLLGLAVWFTVRALRGALPAELRPACPLAAVFWWNLAVLLLTDTRYGDPYFEYRYHLMGAVPLLILAAFTAPALVREPPRLRRAGIVVGVLGMAALVLAVDAGAVGSIWKDDGTIGENGPQREICGVINTMDVEDVIVADDSGTAEICGALDPTRRYITLMSTELQGRLLNTWDGRLTDTDGFTYDRPAAVVCRMDGGLENLPDYLAERCVEVGRASGYLVLRTEGAPLVDGAVGLPFGDSAVDYPNSAWYTYTGQVDAFRCLHTDPAGGEVMRSAGLTLHTDACITLYCTAESTAETAGKVQLWQGEALLAEAPVPGGEGVVSLQAPAGEGYCLVLEMNSGVCADVSRVEFQAAA